MAYSSLIITILLHFLIACDYQAPEESVVTETRLDPDSTPAQVLTPLGSDSTSTGTSTNTQTSTSTSTSTSFFGSTNTGTGSSSFDSDDDSTSITSNTSTATSSGSASTGGSQSRDLDGQYRIDMTSKSVEDGKLLTTIQPAMVHVERSKASIEFTDPFLVQFDGTLDVDDRGVFSGQLSREVNGVTVVLNITSAKITEGIIAGIFSLEIGEENISGDFLGGLDTQEGGVTFTEPSQDLKDFNGTYTITMNRDDGVRYETCFTVEDGRVRGKVANIINFNGLVNKEGELRLHNSSSSPILFSADGIIQPNKSFTGKFSVDNISGDIQGNLRPNCQENDPLVTQSLEVQAALGGFGASFSSSSSSQGDDDDDELLPFDELPEVYTLCAKSDFAGIGKRSLACHFKTGCRSFFNFREDALDSDGNEQEDATFETFDECLNTCQSLEGEEDPEANSLDSLVGGGNFGECETRPKSGFPDGHRLCFRESLVLGGDNPLVCVPEAEGCSFGVDSGTILQQINTSGEKDSDFIFETAAACNNTCQSLELQENPNSHAVEQFTNIGAHFGLCESARQEDPHVLCFSGLSTMFCRLEETGCSRTKSEELGFNRGFLVSVLVTSIAQDLMQMKLDEEGNIDDESNFNDYQSCQETCESLSRKTIPNDKNVDFTAFIYHIGGASLLQGGDLKYGLCRNL